MQTYPVPGSGVDLDMRRIPPPIVNDPLIKVRVNADLYVAGEIVKAGSVVTMRLSDAQALRNSTPPSVEIIK